MAGLVALFCRCYNALTVWLTGNRLPLVSAALALEKTLLRNYPTFTKKLAMLWSLLSSLNFLRPPARAAKRPNGIPRPRSVFVALIGRPRLRKLPRVSAERLPALRRSRRPMICRSPPPFFLFPNPACPLSKPQLPLKRLSLLRLKFPVPQSPRRHDTVPAAVAVAAAAIVVKPAPLPTRRRCFCLLILRKSRSANRLLRR